MGRKQCCTRHIAEFQFFLKSYVERKTGLNLVELMIEITYGLFGVGQIRSSSP